MTIELRHLRYFIAVAEALNFSRAAALLGTAQPSLSQQIRQLEAAVGAELFDRRKRRIALTAAGAEFLVEARALVAGLERAVAHARAAARGMRGELRVAYTVSAMMSALPAAIRAYRAQHPDVRITLRALPPSAIEAALRRREVDAGVVLSHGAPGAGGEFDSRRLAALPLGVLVPAGHRLARRRSVAVGEIGTDTLILFARQLSTIYDVALSVCRERGFGPARVEEVDRIEAILGLVAAGEGVSLVPRLYETLGYRGVAYTAIAPEPDPFELRVAWLRGARSPLVAAFVTTCEQAAGG